MLKDTAQQVAYTSREELIHALAGMKLVNVIRSEHPELFDAELVERIRSECIEAYEAEAKIIDWSLNGHQSENLSGDILKNFIKNRLNDSLIQIGIKPVFEDINKAVLDKTVWFDEDVLGNTATDFFQKRPTEYSKNDRSFGEEDLFE
jgi:ribonucleoside-diphosphate reductase beta chain